MHGNVRVSSILTSESGEWKVGGLEILSSMKEDDAVIYVCLPCVLHACIYGFNFVQDICHARP